VSPVAAASPVQPMTLNRLPVARPLNIHERRNLNLIQSVGLPVAFMTPTATGLQKSLLDAIAPVREFLLKAGIHDYNSQMRGQSHKRSLRGILLSSSGTAPMTVTLYRPDTKDGDPRIWFGRLKYHARAGDMLALFVAKGALHLTNLSGVDLESPAASSYLHAVGGGAARTPAPGHTTQHRPLVGQRDQSEPQPVFSHPHNQEVAALTTELPTTVTVEPTPRILQILGHVNFQGWQCIAELVDNSIDAFLRDADNGRVHGHKVVKVELPAQVDLAAGRGVLSVEDNASGMSLDQMRDACRAGYSGNDPVGKLGLFGMGFNVATVRLGRVTEILSHREGDDSWVGLRLDIDEMIRHGSFDAPVISEPVRPDDGPSGTKVRVSRLAKDGVVRSLIVGRGRGALTKKLARLYHVAMERYGVDVQLNGARLPGWQLCLWGEERSVPSQAWGRVPAQIPIDMSLSPLPYCPSCWEWGTDGQEACYLCGATMIIRQRRIRGFLGIQRSFAVAWGESAKDLHYGIDLIRNGRVIEEFDKDFFYWVDPEDPSRRDLDYPVDAPYLGGRIIGQLEIDFVPLRSYHKDSFEKTDPAWTEIREALRGEAPLRPDVARRYSYERPDTPLARLFDGYRKTSPAGERYLITAVPPGTKQNPREPMHRGALLDEWIQGFESGDEEFQDDRRWWESVQWAETGDQPASEEPVAASPFDVPEAQDEPAPAGDHPSGELVPGSDEPLVVIDEALSRTVNTEGIVTNAPQSLVVRAYRVETGHLADGRAIKVDPRPQGIDFTWDPRHPMFRHGYASPVDSLAAEVAFQVIYRAQVTQRDYPLSYVEQEILERAFPGRTPSVDAAAQRATDLLHAIRDKLESRLPSRAPIAVDLDPVDRAALERAAAGRGVAKTGLPELVSSGRFLELMPLRFVPKCALLFPEVLMGENGVFAFDYEGYDTEDLRAELRESLYSNLLDVAWLVEERPNLVGGLTDMAKLQLRKSLAALDLLELKRLE